MTSIMVVASCAASCTLALACGLNVTSYPPVGGGSGHIKSYREKEATRIATRCSLQASVDLSSSEYRSAPPECRSSCTMEYRAVRYVCLLQRVWRDTLRQPPATFKHQPLPREAVPSPTLLINPIE